MIGISFDSVMTSEYSKNLNFDIKARLMPIDLNNQHTCVYSGIFHGLQDDDFYVNYPITTSLTNMMFMKRLPSAGAELKPNGVSYNDVSVNQVYRILMGKFGKSLFSERGSYMLH